MNTTWIEEVRGLTKTFAFEDFNAALAFVNRVGGVAEKMHHHPDIAIRNYNTVTVTTITHDKDNTVTEKDQALAAAIDTVVEKGGVWIRFQHVLKKMFTTET